ncbi:alanine racemase [Sphaerisporangium sp. NPDC051017]|uniref:alanine racemase n=1 Tax=Sphaerisporangium sp. NPDC051017 TaxID=3154636 RepID=UPI003438DE33
MAERIRVCLDEAAIRDNIRAVRHLSGTAQVMGVVKANAYGHGLVPAARLLVHHGVHQLAVATPEEACVLREAGLRAPITVLSPTSASAMAELVARRVRPSLSTLAAARDLHRAAVRLGRRAPVHLEVDTGLGRYGWAPTPAGVAQIERLTMLDHLVVASVYTHLGGTCRDSLADGLQRFQRMYEKVVEVLGHRPARHALASSALAAGLHNDTPLEMVRPGALLYGLAPAYAAAPLGIGLRSVLSLTSHIAHVSEMPAGASIGYDATYRTLEPVVVAVVPAGFADGIPRVLAGAGRVLIHGCHAPIIGTVGMTHLTVDVTDIPQAALGDAVTLIGAQGVRAIDAQEWARLAGTINSDVLTRVAPTFPRTVITPHAPMELSA